MLLAWGSRSMSSVGLPRSASAGGQVDGGGGLAHTAFLIGDGNDHCGDARVILGIGFGESKG